MTTQTPLAPTPRPQAPALAPAPTSQAGRALLWTGGILGAALVAWSGLQLADLLSQSSHSAPYAYDAAPVVELVADGPVTVVAGGSGVDVVASTRTGFSTTASYDATVDGGRLVVRNECDGWWSQSCTAGLDVQLPEGTQVVVRSSSGKVVTSGALGDLEVHTGDGRLAVDGVQGSVVASSGSGPVAVSGVSGRVEASTNDGEVEVSRADGDVLATSGSGRVRVHEADGDVEARTSDGVVEVGDVRGAVLARSGSGRVSLETVGGRAEARTSDGEIEITDAGGDAVAASGSGSVRVSAIEGRVEASTNDGQIEVDGATGDAAVKSGSGSVTVSAVRGDVEARTNDGRVVVHGTGGAVALDISTADGRSTVDAPTDPAASRTVTIRSGSGDVSYLGPR